MTKSPAADAERDQALHLAISQIEKQHGKGAIMRMAGPEGSGKTMVSLHAMRPLRSRI